MSIEDDWRDVANRPLHWIGYALVAFCVGFTVNALLRSF